VTTPGGDIYTRGVQKKLFNQWANYAARSNILGGNGGKTVGYNPGIRPWKKTNRTLNTTQRWRKKRTSKKDKKRGGYYTRERSNRAEEGGPYKCLPAQRL